jgi:hypothetical protein
VESQIEAAASAGRAPRRDQRTPSEIQLIRDKEALLLSRTRVSRELESSRHERYRQILRKALASLDSRIANLDEALKRLEKT